MAMFQQYQGGIAPVQGISEAGANIGRMTGSGLADMGKSLAEGIQAYHENTAKWDMVSGEADALASQVANTQKLFLSHPAYAPLAEALSPYVDQLSGVKSQSLPKALGTLNAVKTAYAGTMQQFPLYEAVRKEKEYGAFGEGVNDPNNTTNTVIAPVGTHPQDVKWDYTKNAGANIFAAGAYYDRYKSANPTVKLRDKNDWLQSWLQGLPNQIANDTKVDKFVRQKAIENVVKLGAGGLFKPSTIQSYYSEDSKDIPEYANPNAPLGAQIARIAAQNAAPSPAGTYGNLSLDTKPISRVFRNPITGELSILPERNASKPVDRFYPLATGGFATGQPKTESGVNAVVPNKQGQLESYSSDIYSYALSAGVEPSDFAEGLRSSGLSPDEYYKSITTPVGGAEPVQMTPDKGVQLTRVPQNIVDYSKSLGVSIKEFTDGWKASGLTVDEYFKSVSTPVAEPVTPAVKAPSAQPKVSPPTPAYSGKAQPTPAPATAPAPARTQATAPAPAPVRAPAPAPVVESESVAEPERTAPVQQQSKPAVTIVTPKTSIEPKVSPPTPAYSGKASTPSKYQESDILTRGLGKSVKEGEITEPSNGEYSEPAFGKISLAKNGKNGPDGKPLTSAYKINPDSTLYTVKRGEQVWQIAQRMGVHMDALAELNGFPISIKSDDLWKLSNERGGLYVPEKVKKEDLPERLRNKKSITMNAASGGRFAAFMPNIDFDVQANNKESPSNSTSPESPVETPATTPSSVYVPPLGSKEITPVGEKAVSPEEDEAARTAAGMSTDDWAKVKVARGHIRAQTDDAWKGKYSYSNSLDYLRRMRDSVADGNSDQVDYGPYGQWEKLHPDAAVGVAVGADAATLLLSATKIQKISQAKKLIDREQMVADSAKKAFEVIKKARADELAKGPKMIGAGGQVGATLERRTAQRLAAEEAKLFEDALKKSGVTVDAEIKAKLATMDKSIYKQIASTTFWTSFFESVYGVKNATPDGANDNPETRAYLDTTLDGVRKLRTGYMPVGFGGGEGWLKEAIGTWKPLSGKEQIDIVKYLDEKIAEGQVKHDNYAGAWKAGREDLYDPQRLLSRYADISRGSPNANQVDTAYKPSEALGTESSIIGSRSFTVEKSTEEKRGLLRNFMQKRLGYVPQGFDTMFNTQFPEATLKMQETPYGVMYHDGKGEWKPMPSQKANAMSFSDMAKEKSVMFGEPQGNGTFKPTEFIKGSGIRIGGIGSFGSPEAASKFRENYPKLIAAKQLASELKALNEQTGRSWSPANWGTAAAKVSQLIAQMRVALIGVGSVSDYEQQLMKDLVQDPTQFFSLQSTTRSKYNAMIENIDNQIQTMPQSFGLTVELDTDKAKDLLSARRAYQEANNWNQLTPQQRAEIKGLNK